MNEDLLKIYDKIMHLKIFVDSEDDILKAIYLDASKKHNDKLMKNPEHIDGGFDLYSPGNKGDELVDYGETLRFSYISTNKLDYEIICSAKIYTDQGKSYNTGYYMYPRSSLSKTQLRLANCTGIIDAGYRGHLIGMFDVISHEEQSEYSKYYGSAYDRYLQICAPGLVPIVVEIVKTIEELGEKTERGEGGFGSTGK